MKRQLRTHSGRLGAFGLGTALSAIASLSVFPAGVHAAGAEGWAGIAIGQSVGAVAAALIQFGWSVTGTFAVARSEPLARPRLYWQSVAAKTYLYLALLPILTVTVAVSAPAYQVESVVTAATWAAMGLSGTWFFVGTGDATGLLRRETLPRSVLPLLGAASVYTLDADLAWLVVSQLLGVTLSLVLTSTYVGRASERVSWRPRAVASTLQGQGKGAGLQLVSAIYVYLPVNFVAAFAPSAVAPYASADKMGKAALLVLTPVFQFAKGVVQGAETDVARKVRFAARSGLVLAALCAASFGALLPPTVRLLSENQIDVSLALSAWVSLGLFAVVSSQMIGLVCLVALDALDDALRSTLLGAVAAVPLLVILCAQYGAVGGAAAVALSEIVVLAYQLLALNSRLSSQDKP